MKTTPVVGPILFAALLFLGVSMPMGAAQEKAAAKAAKDRDELGQMGLQGGDLKSALGLLNFFEPQPKWKQDLLSRAYEVFSQKADVRYADLLADEQISKICDAQKLVLLGGPMLGHVSETGVDVWVRTAGRGKVTVRVKDSGGPGLFGPVEATPENDFAAVVKIAGLQPKRSYTYSVEVDGKPVPGAAGVIKTTDTAQTRIVFGSCPHRWGFAHTAFWDRVLSRNPDALLMYGDIAVQDRGFNFGMHRFDYLLRDMNTPFRKLGATLPVYAAWDDHDYIGNDQWGLGSGKKTGTKADRLQIRHVFQTSWNNPAYGFNSDKGGIFFRTRIGAADVIMTDHRYFRAVEGPFLGEEQMKWLEEQLLDCKGPFTVITCGTMWSDYVSGGKDSWGVFDRDGRERLFEFIEKHHVPGVIFLSGDRHGARGFKIPRPSGQPFYEFEPASLGGRGIGAGTNAGKGEHQLFGIANKYAFGELTFDTQTKEPTATFRLVLTDGSEHYKITLTQSQLTP